MLTTVLPHTHTPDTQVLPIYPKEHVLTTLNDSMTEATISMAAAARTPTNSSNNARPQTAMSPSGRAPHMAAPQQQQAQPEGAGRPQTAPVVERKDR